MIEVRISDYEIDKFASDTSLSAFVETPKRNVRNYIHNELMKAAGCELFEEWIPLLSCFLDIDGKDRIRLSNNILWMTKSYDPSTCEHVYKFEMKTEESL